MIGVVISDTIRFVLTNLPAILFVLALVVPALIGARTAERYLAWQLLLAIGVQGCWAGLFHVLFPETAASFIGWQVSPFQFEIGIADIALGITAIVAFWRPLEFKTAVVVFVAVFYFGLVYGHIHQIVSTGNYSPGNAGALLVLTVIQPLLMIWLLVAARRSASRPGA